MGQNLGSPAEAVWEEMQVEKLLCMGSQRELKHSGELGGRGGWARMLEKGCGRATWWEAGEGSALR